MTRASPWWAPDVYADRRPFLKARGRITAAVRNFFENEGFEEVETAALQVSGGNETHLSAFATELIGADGARSAVARAHVPGAERNPCVFAYHEVIRAPAATVTSPRMRPVPDSPADR